MIAVAAHFGGRTEIHLREDRAVTDDEIDRFTAGRTESVEIEPEAVASHLTAAERVWMWPTDGSDPSAILQRDTATADRAMDSLWSAAECADHLQVKKSTWFSYVHRPTLKNPAPAPHTVFRGIPLWSPDEVIRFGKQRRRSSAAAR